MSSNTTAVEELEFGALYETSSLMWTLTGDENWDNVIFTLLTVLIGELVSDSLARLANMQRRRWFSSTHSLSYHAQARTALYDNFSRRKINQLPVIGSQGRSDTYHGDRNTKQVVGILILIVLKRIIDTGMSYAGLPDSRDILVDDTQLTSFRTVPRSQGRLRSNGRTCAANQVIDVANTKSTESWTFCSYQQVGFRASNRTVDRLLLLISVAERNGAKWKIDTSFDALSFLSTATYQIQVGSYYAELLDNATVIRKNFLRNANLLSSKTGLNVSFASDVLPGFHSELLINASVVKGDNGRVMRGDAVLRLRKTRIWIDRIMLGIIEFRGKGSRLLTVFGDPALEGSGEEPISLGLLNGKLKIGEYNGTRLPVFVACILFGTVLAISFVLALCLKSPEGLAWEVITAHRRLCTDRLLSGEENRRTLTASRKIEDLEERKYYGYGIPEGYEPIENPDTGDIFNAKPCGTVSDEEYQDQQRDASTWTGSVLSQST